MNSATALKRQTAFTIIELLVATAILTVLLILVAEITNSITISSTLTQRHADADRVARLLFDRMSMDIESAPTNPQLDCFVAKKTGNDSFFFFSEAPGYFARDPSPTARSLLSLIGYRINPGKGMERLGKGLTWDGDPSGDAGGGITFLTDPGPTNGSASPQPIFESTLTGRWLRTIGSEPDFQGTDENYHLVNPHIYRFEICFQLAAGVLGEQTTTFSSTPPLTAPNGRCTLAGIDAIIVAVALVDGVTAETITDDNRIESCLPDPTFDDLNAVPPRLMAAIWQTQLSSTTFAGNAHIPPAAVSKIRVYQRFFRLSHL